MAKKDKEKKESKSKSKEKTKDKEIKSVELSVQEKFLQYAMDDMKAIERQAGIGSSLEADYRISSGSLMLDYVYGGGITSCWYTLLGGEQSAKSTNAMEFLRECINNKIPAYYGDAEGSVDGTYTASICRVKQLRDVFGEQDEKGKWVVAPKARYYDENLMETLLGLYKERLLNLPDKKFRKETGQWLLGFHTNRKSHMKMLDALDLKVVDKTRKIHWAETDSSALQAAFFLDSYPALLPEVTGDDEDTESQGIALQAREYSKWIPQLSGLIRRKHCVFLGVNQIRTVPMAKPWEKQYNEPCGNALQFYSAVRVKFTSCSISSVEKEYGGLFGEGKSQFTVEPSVEFEGQKDKYAYKKIENVKNKKGTPWLNAFQRVWYADGEGKGRGVDPVFDCWAYLCTTDQVEGSAKKTFKINISSEWKDITFDWLLFKKCILAECYKNKELLKELQEELKKYKIKKLNIYSICKKQLNSGKYKELIRQANISSGGSDEEEDYDYDSEEI